MSMSDPIADMLTRIRNANSARKPHVDIPASKVKGEILKVMAENRYIQRYNLIESEGGVKKIYRVYLKYTPDRERIIKNLKRISRPGLRKYVEASTVPKVLNGLGLAIVSTSKGMLSDHQCRQENVGGELGKLSRRVPARVCQNMGRKDELISVL